MAFDFALVEAPFRMQPGLRRIAAGSTQLTTSALGGRHLREKMAVLSAFADEALCSADGYDPLPVLQALAREPARRCDGKAAFAIDDLRNARAARLGWALRDGAPEGDGDPAIGALLDALRPEQRCSALLCLAFEEDFAVIDGVTTTLPWLAVCLPSRWAPADKLGLPFAAVHAAVADSRTIVAAAPQLVHLVTSASRWERFVWTISADPHLHQHPARGLAAWPVASGSTRADADALAAMASFRSERQTFIPVAGTRSAIFTIRVDSRPLTEAVITADAARRLHSSLASMTPAVLAYKGLQVAQSRLLDWLARRIDSSPPGAR